MTMDGPRFGDGSNPGVQPLSDESLRLTAASFAAISSSPALPGDTELARLADQVTLPAPDEVGCVFFTCGTARWGARLDAIHRIIPRGITPPVMLPGCPPWVAGIIRSEAEFATLVDTARFLYGTPSLVARAQRHHGILLVAVRDALLGLFVTHLSLATTVRANEIGPVPFAEEDKDDVPSATDGAAPFFLARYLPEGEPNPQAAGATAFLDVQGIAAACLGELDGAEEDDDV
jgi:chemotaxis signal transduction protein